MPHVSTFLDLTACSLRWLTTTSWKVRLSVGPPTWPLCLGFKVSAAKDPWHSPLCYEADKNSSILHTRQRGTERGQPLKRSQSMPEREKGLHSISWLSQITLPKHHFKNAIHWSSAQISWALVCSTWGVLLWLAILTSIFWLAHWNSVEQLLLFFENCLGRMVKRRKKISKLPIRYWSFGDVRC